MSIESQRINQRNWAKRNPEYIKNWKKNNRERILEQRRPKYKRDWQKQKEAVLAEKKRKVEFINSCKNRPCMDCFGFYPPVVMHFDHRDPKTKFRDLSVMGTYSYQKIKAEIDKCDVVCANCHSLRTDKMRKEGKIKIFGRYNVQK